MAAMSLPMTSPTPSPCVFCQITRTRRLSHSRTSILLHSVKGHGLRAWHALAKVSPGGTRKFLLEQALCRNVTHMLKVGQILLQQDAPQSKLHRFTFPGRYVNRFGFHQPPLNSDNHIHLHCLALPFIPKWKQVKYMPLGPFAGFIEAEKLLNRIKPE